MSEPRYSKEGTLSADTVETVNVPASVGRVLIKMFGSSGHAKFTVDGADPVLGAGEDGGGRIEAGGAQGVDVDRNNGTVPVKLLSASALEWSVEGYLS